MFKYKKAEIVTYFLLIFFTALFSALLLAKGYAGWFLFAAAAVVAPCAAMLCVVFRRNYALSFAERCLAEENYEKLDEYAAKREKKYFFLKVYRIDSLLERGDAEAFEREYAAYTEKYRLPKEWLFRLEAYKAFCELLKNGAIAFRAVGRLESEIAAEEVEKERGIVKIFGYYFKKDLERAAKQIGWYDRAGETRFIGLMYDFACCLVERAANGAAAEAEAALRKAAYNDFLKGGAERLNAVAALAQAE